MRGTRLPALIAIALTGCLGASFGNGGGAGSGKSPSPGAASSPDLGTSSPPAPPPPGMSLPPPMPPAPGGFQLAIAPLLDGQGCTECHHAGRPIDLTRYPFRSGDAATAAQQLIDSLAGAMPPPPRDAAPASLVAAVVKWKTDGMKP